MVVIGVASMLTVGGDGRAMLTPWFVEQMRGGRTMPVTLLLSLSTPLLRYIPLIV